MEKASISINGVSLTISKVAKQSFYNQYYPSHAKTNKLKIS